VTGANSGIGLEVARDLYKRGAKVILTCRSQEKGDATIKEIKKSDNDGPKVGKLVFEQLDLASFSSVEDFCRRITKKEKSIDILINNAGVFTMERFVTGDGIEQTFQVNHLSPFLLTNILIDLLKASGDARIVNVSSKGHWFSIGLPKDISWEKTRFIGLVAYGNSKLAQILTSNEMAKKLKDDGISVYTLHPGAVATGITQNIPTTYLPQTFNQAISRVFKWTARTPAQGAQPVLYCALAPNLPSGYYEDDKLGWANPLAKNVEMAKSAWQLSEEMTGFTTKI